MPALDDAGVRDLLTWVRDLLTWAREPAACELCGWSCTRDYCRTCDEFYWYQHATGCPMFDPHDGHRLTIVPFVEVR